MIITAEHFEKRVGSLPVQDDLERCNCPDAGRTMHTQCGWDVEFDLPVFLVGRDPTQRESFRNNLLSHYSQRD